MRRPYSLACLAAWQGDRPAAVTVLSSGRAWCMRGWWLGAQQADFGVMPDITSRAVSGDAPRRARRRPTRAGGRTWRATRRPRCTGRPRCASTATRRRRCWPRRSAWMRGSLGTRCRPTCRCAGLPALPSCAAGDFTASMGVSQGTGPLVMHAGPGPSAEHGWPGVPERGHQPASTCARGRARHAAIPRQGPGLRAARRAAGRGHAGGRGARVGGVRRRHRRGGRRRARLGPGPGGRGVQERPQGRLPLPAPA